MKSWVQILSTPTADTPGTTLLVHFDDRRYFFGNIAEGTQRTCVQRKISITKVGDIFLTGTINWATTGGIIGMILTTADATSYSRLESIRQKDGKQKGGDTEKPWLNIHGGKNLTHLLATARRFVFRKGMPVYTDEFTLEEQAKRKDWEPTWSDDNIRVWAMVVAPEGQQKSPRKRSHDEISGDSPVAPKESLEALPDEQEDRDQQLRKSVVSSMFDSEWRMDALVTKKLSDIQMPAHLFVRDSNGRIKKYTGPLPGRDEKVPDIEVLLRNPWPAAMIEDLPPSTPSNTAVSYIIKNYPQRGKFDPKEAIRLGVKPGPDFRTLTNGGSITTKDGIVVTSEQVLGKSKEASSIAIIELPDSSYVEPLLAREEWTSTDLMNGLEVIVWILGPDVVHNLSLMKFMQDRSSVKHIVSSKDCCSNYLALESPAAAAINLHLLDAEHFPIPAYNNTVETATMGVDVPYERARVGTLIQMVPKVEFQDDKIVHYLDTNKVVEDASKEVLDLAAKARAEVTNEGYQAKLNELQKDIPSKDAEVISLGTGSALPSKYRNVSATLLRVPGYGSYLFDCGENTLGQLKRVFGKKLPEVLQDLKAIWISHLHADHHLGTAAVIKAWHEETSSDEPTANKRLVIASDFRMLDWLREYSQVENYGYERLKTVRMGLMHNALHEKFSRDMVKEFGLTSISACNVDHCHGSLAVVLDFPNGFRAAYSGDCRPSEEFSRLGKGATLLIHEATFDDELEMDALSKKHCTTSEALGVGKKMEARRILLTHFSQRYQKIPVMNEGTDQVAIVAFDYMRVKIEDFSKIAAFRPALLKLYDGKSE